MSDEEIVYGYRCSASHTLQQFHKSASPVRVLLGPVGCLSPETEVMTPDGWVRMDEWDGEDVMQWEAKNCVCKFVAPVERIVMRAELPFIRFRNNGKLSMVLSECHRVPMYDEDGVFRVKTAIELSESPRGTIIAPEWGVGNLDGVVIDRVESSDGNQYCFDVPTGFFVARHDGCIFITGNSGKSFAAQGEVHKLANEMPPCKDGVRRSAYAFIRDTATNLKDTTMKTWMKMFPELLAGSGVTKVNWSPPMDMTCEYALKDGTRVELKIYCRHQACVADAENLKSLELTGVYVNEANNVPYHCIMAAIARTGRYPDKDKMSINPETGEPFEPRFCTILDSNMADDQSWLFRLYSDPPKGWEFFRQPPAMFYAGKNPVTGKPRYVPNRGQKIAQGILPADNIDKLPEGFRYYAKMIPGNSHDWINLYVCANWGNIQSGMPVYPNYNDQVHYVDSDIKFDRTKTLFLGFDWGLHPSCVFVQMSDNGQVQVLEEVDGEGVKMGIEYLWESKLRTILINDYGWGRGTQVFAIGDPATGTSQVDMSNCIVYLAKQGLEVTPCKTNDPATRIGAVDHFMRLTVDKGKPALCVCKKAPTLRAGMAGRYFLKRLENQARESFSAVPDKNNPYSHLQDAFQYVCHAIRNPEMYNFAWRNSNSCGSDMEKRSVAMQPKCDMAGW